MGALTVAELPAAPSWVRTSSGFMARLESLAALVAEVAPVAAIPNTRASKIVSRSEANTFNGSISWDECIAHSRGEGWTVGDAVSSRLESLAPVMREVDARRVRRSWDVAGGAVNVGRYLSGEPRCMVRARVVPAPRSGRVVTVLVNRGATHNVSAATLQKNGAVIVALLEALRRSGISVDLWVALCAQVDDGTIASVLTHCAHAGEGAADTADVTFMVAHPSAHRRLVFGMRESLPGLPRRKFARDMGMSCAIPAEVAEPLEAALTIDLVMLSEQADHDAWLRSTLEALGVAFE